jgi:hypothetical protein
MSTQLRESARIYTFPTLKVRASVAEARLSARSASDLELSATAVAASGGSGWYHDAAVEEATPERKR